MIRLLENFCLAVCFQAYFIVKLAAFNFMSV